MVRDLEPFLTIFPMKRTQETENTSGRRVRRLGTAAFLATATATAMALGACGNGQENTGPHDPRPDRVTEQGQDPAVGDVGDVGEEGHDSTSPTTIVTGTNVTIGRVTEGSVQENCNGMTLETGDENVRIYITVGNGDPKYPHIPQVADDALYIQAAALNGVAIEAINVGATAIFTGQEGTRSEDEKHNYRREVTDAGWFFQIPPTIEGSSVLAVEVPYVEPGGLKKTAYGYLGLTREASTYTFEFNNGGQTKTSHTYGREQSICG